MKFAPRLKAFQRRFWVVVPSILATAGVVQAADIPISGTYGTVAMCIIDAFMDVPPGDVNFNAGGAPLAQLLAGEFDTTQESCAFRKIMSQSDSDLTSAWVVEAVCTEKAGDVAREFKITSDKQSRSVVVGDLVGTVLATLDECSVPYAERLSRELKRIQLATKK